MLGGATSTLGFDTSEKAIDLARRNAIANHAKSARFEMADVFDTLDALREVRARRFGMVVCDPPKFARHPKALEDAIKGYLRLNRAAVDVLEPGGVLVTCSCSGLVDRTMFLDILGQVAERGEPADPPPRAARPGARPSGLGLVPGDGISQMRDRPRLLTHRG